MDCTKLFDTWMKSECATTSKLPICKGLTIKLLLCLSKNECIFQQDSVIKCGNSFTMPGRPIK